MKKARAVVKIEKDKSDRDKSAYEGDDTNAQFMFNKRKFFQAIGTIRLNELIKQYGLYEPHQTKDKRWIKCVPLKTLRTLSSMKYICKTMEVFKSLKQL